MDISLFESLTPGVKRLFGSAKSGLLILCLAFSFGCFNAVLIELSHFLSKQLQTSYHGLSVRDFMFLFALGGVMGQALIPLLWCGFSRKLLLWRIAVFFGAILLLLFPFFVQSSQSIESIELWLPVALAAYIPMSIYRFVGRWEIVPKRGNTIGDSRQVCIIDLGTLTLVTAVTIATQLHYRQSIDKNHMFAGLELLIMWILAGFTLFVAAVSLAFLFQLMEASSRRRIVASLGIVLLAIGAAIGLIAYESKAPYQAICLVAAYCAPFLIIAVASIRWTGRSYRLSKHLPTETLDSTHERAIANIN